MHIPDQSNALRFQGGRGRGRIKLERMEHICGGQFCWCLRLHIANNSLWTCRGPCGLGHGNTTARLTGTEASRPGSISSHLTRP